MAGVNALGCLFEFKRSGGVGLAIGLTAAFLAPQILSLEIDRDSNDRKANHGPPPALAATDLWGK